jgi:carboxypeptidase Taq
MTSQQGMTEAEVLRHYREIDDIGSVLSVLYWDMESKMPTGGAELRGRQIGALSALAHRMESDPAYVAGALGLDPQTPNGRILQRRILNSICVDESFVKRRSETQVRCQQRWKEARKARDFSMVQGPLQELIDLEREWVRRLKAHPQATAFRDLTPFEICLGNFERGLPQARVEQLLSRLGPELKTRIPQILKRQPPRNEATLARDLQPLAMPLPAQKTLLEKVVGDLGFNFHHGRMDESAHPFCGGHPVDTRITTRYVAGDFTNALSSATHECGHALYEQGLPKDLLGTPAGTAASYGVHESQSRFLENQIGRSRGFCRYLSGVTGVDADLLFRHANEVRPTLIRVDADEVTYNLHILIRFDIERRLINGEIDAVQIPALWNAGYADLLGLEVPHDGDGCLQDVHWYSGSFGYFATYTLGNLLAAELFADFASLYPDWEERVARGDFAFVKAFLAERVHHQAALGDSPTTMKRALGGREVSTEAFLRYVDRKYLG